MAVPGWRRGILHCFSIPLSRVKEAGAEVELFYAHKMEIGHCTGEMYCWYEKPEHVTFRMICRYYIPSCGNVTS